VRVRVDRRRCQGHNRCQLLAPELFDVDEEGYAREANEGRVSPGSEDQARRAAVNCPELAIALEEDA
jgi:ferredoxin